MKPRIVAIVLGVCLQPSCCPFARAVTRIGFGERRLHPLSSTSFTTTHA
jgi:hypothetical protein